VTIRVNTSDGLKLVSRLRFVKSGRLSRVLRVSRVKDDLSLEPVFNGVPSLAVVISPNPASFSSTASPTVEGSVSSSVTGGMPPFSYAWSIFSSTRPTAITSPITSSTNLRQTGLAADETGYAVVKIDVSDASGQAATSSVDVDFTNFGVS
jgi:hypothetical protein